MNRTGTYEAIDTTNLTPLSRMGDFQVSSNDPDVRGWDVPYLPMTRSTLWRWPMSIDRMPSGFGGLKRLVKRAPQTISLAL